MTNDRTAKLQKIIDETLSHLRDSEAKLARLLQSQTAEMWRIQEATASVEYRKRDLERLKAELAEDKRQGGETEAQGIEENSSKEGNEEGRREEGAQEDREEEGSPSEMILNLYRKPGDPLFCHHDA